MSGYGGQAPEVAVFGGIGSRNCLAVENMEGHSWIAKRLPPELASKCKLLWMNPTRALKTLPNNSQDLITMFNEFADVEVIKDDHARALFMAGVARVLRIGGQLVITGDSLMMDRIKKLEKELGANELSYLNLRPVVPVPEDRAKPMWGRGWIFASILAENTLNFDYDAIAPDEFDDSSLDGSILVMEKVAEPQGPIQRQ